MRSQMAGAAQPGPPAGAAALGAQGTYHNSPIPNPPFYRVPMTPTRHGRQIPTLSGYENPALAAATAAAASGVEAVGATSRGDRPPMASRSHAPMRLSATATAFSMPGGVSGSPDQHHDTAAAAAVGNSGGEPGPNLAGPEHGQEMERRRGEEMERQDRPRGAGGMFAAMATARARADEAIPAHNPDGSWAVTQGDRHAQVGGGGGGGGVGVAHGGRMQHGPHGPYLQVVPLSRMVALPSEPGVGAQASGGVAGVNNGGGAGAGAGAGAGTGAGDTEHLEQSPSHLAMMPAFRHWESQRARLRIQVRFLLFLNYRALPRPPFGKDIPAPAFFGRTSCMFLAFTGRGS